jgi:hypothetical protein
MKRRYSGLPDRHMFRVGSLGYFCHFCRLDILFCSIHYSLLFCWPIGLPARLLHPLVREPAAFLGAAQDRQVRRPGHDLLLLWQELRYHHIAAH